MTPSSRASAKPIDGRSACSSSFSNSPQMRSAGRSSSAIDEQMRAVSGSIVSSNRAANCRARRTRRESSAKRLRIHDAEDTEFEVVAAVNGSRYSSVSGSQPIALIVKSRRRAASSNGIDGSPSTRESLVAAAGLRFAARQRHVDVAELVDRKRLAGRHDLAERLQQRQQRILRDAEDLDVEILRRPVQQAIADESADAQRAAARVAHGGGNAPRLLFQIHVNSI